LANDRSAIESSDSLPIKRCRVADAQSPQRMSRNIQCAPNIRGPRKIALAGDRGPL
jgi:hypothetical protein